MLVSGYSGVGKSSVVNELHKALVPPRGLFASGKFDQYKRDIPYATLAQAFQSLVRQILGKSEAEWQVAEALKRGAGPERPAHRRPDPRAGAHHRQTAAGRRTCRRRTRKTGSRWYSGGSSACSHEPEHPLALFLDDLQWLDAATLDFLEHLVTHAEVRHLLLIGAYRDNEVGPAHPLMRTLEAIREAGVRVSRDRAGAARA